jgi:hypothetical protein
VAGVYAQCDPARANKERAAAAKARAEAETIARKLVLTDEDLAQSEREAHEWVKEWKKSLK